MVAFAYVSLVDMNYDFSLKVAIIMAVMKKSCPITALSGSRYVLAKRV